MEMNVANRLQIVNDTFQNVEKNDDTTENEKRIAESIIEILNGYIYGRIEEEVQLEMDEGEYLIQLYVSFVKYIK